MTRRRAPWYAGFLLAGLPACTGPQGGLPLIPAGGPRPESVGTVRAADHRVPTAMPVKRRPPRLDPPPSAPPSATIRQPQVTPPYGTNWEKPDQKATPDYVQPADTHDPDELPPEVAGPVVEVPKNVERPADPVTPKVIVDKGEVAAPEWPSFSASKPSAPEVAPVKPAPSAGHPRPAKPELPPTNGPKTPPWPDFNRPITPRALSPEEEPTPRPKREVPPIRAAEKPLEVPPPVKIPGPPPVIEPQPIETPKPVERPPMPKPPELAPPLPIELPKPIEPVVPAIPAVKPADPVTPPPVAPVPQETPKSPRRDTLLVRAIRAFQDNKSEEGIELLKQLDPKKADLVVQLVPVICAYSEPGKPALSPDEVNAVTEKVRRAMAMLQEGQGLKLRTVCAADHVAGYGRYSPRDPVQPFMPGYRVQLYVEVRNVTWKPTASKCGVFNELTIRARLMDDRDRVCYDSTWPLSESRQCAPADYYLSPAFGVPESLPPGRYSLQIDVTDVPGKSSAGGRVPLRVERE